MKSSGNRSGLRLTACTSPSLSVGIALGRLDHGNVGFLDTEFFRQLGVARLPAKRFAQPRAQARKLLGAAPDGRHVALAVDDHEVAGDPRLVAVRIRIFEKNLRDDSRILRIAHVEYGGAEPLLVGDV